MSSLLLLLFSIIPHDNDILVDNFEKVELNHFYDDQGRHVFDQVIWYDWDHLLHQHKIEAWRLVKEPSYLPILNRHTNKYESLFIQNDNYHLVKAKYYVESWTQYDPELFDRETYKKEDRIDLKQKPKKVELKVESIRIFGVPIYVK